MKLCAMVLAFHHRPDGDDRERRRRQQQRRRGPRPAPGTGHPTANAAGCRACRRGGRCLVICRPSRRSAEVAAGPFQSPSTARTGQVYFSPAFSFSFGVHRVSLSPASTVASSLSPAAPFSSKTYFALACFLSAMLRLTRVISPGGTRSPSAGVCGAGRASRSRTGRDPCPRRTGPGRCQRGS